MRVSVLLGIAGVVAAASVASGQVSLNAFMTADNAFEASLSTSPFAAGPTNFLTGNSWGATYNASFPINMPGTYYLQVVAQDFGDPAAFIGSFGLFNFQAGWSASFSNGTNGLYTNTTDWIVSDVDFGVVPVAPVSFGTDGVSPWGDRPLIDNAALNIWHPSNGNTVYFTTVITVVPAPGAAALLGLGGLVATRRRR